MNKKWLAFTDQVKAHYQMDFVPLHEPTFNGKELEYVTDCIQTGWVSSVGAYVNRFEEDLARFTGVRRAVAVVNGTAALHIALKLVGVQAHEEVFMPALTFVATANAVSYLGAVPHFVDVSEKTLGLDPQKLEAHILAIGEVKNNQLINKKTGRVIRAVVPMHTFGHAVELEELQVICEKYHLILVEDAAESLGTYYKGKQTGSFGKVSAISFNGNKIMTTGGGGAILTDDEALADYAKHITTTAKVPHRWEFEHDEVAFNYRLPNINAALGCAQLEKMPEFIEQKRALTAFYEELVAPLEGVTLFKEPTNSFSNYWLQTLIIDDTLVRDDVLAFLNDHGVMSRPIWTPLHKLKPYRDCPRADLSTIERLNKKIINIPSTPIKEG
ncbi:LegC family aminotransferase [Solibacillus sp. FSL R7-0682]|uniref:LegC family aminotransferase n=1 Tax=Solibacillus sp. FSL R7-0682 TaxID=2921690 RepID=UPI0030FBAB1B